MPVGHPKDPAAHAAVLAANREKRQAATATKLGIKPTKRVYKRRNTKQPSLLSTKKFTSEILSETNTVVTKQGNVVKELETEIEDLKVKLEIAMKSNEQLRDRAETAERRFITLIDLAARLGL